VSPERVQRRVVAAWLRVITLALYAEDGAAVLALLPLRSWEINWP